MPATYKPKFSGGEFHSQLASSTATFLFKNQEPLVELLRQVGEFECAAKVAGLDCKMTSRAPDQSMATEVLIHAEQCLMEAPIHIGRPHGGSNSDFDAALRWMGARLSEHIHYMERVGRRAS